MLQAFTSGRTDIQRIALHVSWLHGPISPLNVSFCQYQHSQLGFTSTVIAIRDTILKMPGEAKTSEV